MFFAVCVFSASCGPTSIRALSTQRRSGDRHYTLIIDLATRSLLRPVLIGSVRLEAIQEK